VRGGRQAKRETPRPVPSPATRCCVATTAAGPRRAATTVHLEVSARRRERDSAAVPIAMSCTTAPFPDSFHRYQWDVVASITP